MGTLTAKMDKGGRVMLPQRFRLELGLTEGSELIVRVVDGEIRLTPPEAAWDKARAICMALNTSGESVVDELSRERREEAARELKDSD